MFESTAVGAQKQTRGLLFVKDIVQIKSQRLSVSYLFLKYEEKCG